MSSPPSVQPVNFVWLERKVKEWGCMQALIDFDGWRRWKDYAAQSDSSKKAKDKDKDKDGGKKKKGDAAAVAAPVSPSTNTTTTAATAGNSNGVADSAVGTAGKPDGTGAPPENLPSAAAATSKREKRRSIRDADALKKGGAGDKVPAVAEVNGEGS